MGYTVLNMQAVKNSFAPVIFSLFKARSVATEPRKPKGDPKGGQWTADKPNAHGHQPNDPALVALAKEMGAKVPPTSWDLQQHTDPKSRYAWTWRDSKGVQQQIYSESGQAERDAKKVKAIAIMKDKLPQIRLQLKHDLRRPDAEPERIAAAVAAIIDQTTMRIGNEIYAKKNGTYGASSLRKEHVSVKGDTITFNFSGKHSKEHTIVMKDKLVADAVNHLLTLPGDRLMQYHVDNAKRSTATMEGGLVNKYLKPFGITAKSFRTFHATMMAKELLDDAGAPLDEKDAAKKITAVVKLVAAKLGNTPAVCKSSYISPAVLADYARSVA